MTTTRGKYSRGIEWILKLLILAVAIYLIAERIDPQSYKGVFSFSWHQASLIIPGFFILWLLNLILDALIWKKVHSMAQPISMRAAFKTNLVCYSLAFVTPVNSGELAGRYLMLNSSAYRKKTVFLTFWSHFPRLIVKLIIGGLALGVLLRNKSEPSLYWMVFLMIMLLLLGYFLFRNIQRWLAEMGYKGFKLKDYLLHERPKFDEKLELLALAATKFFTYNTQFILLLILWADPILNANLIASVFAMYVLGALLPTLPAADFLVKAGIAIAVFNPNMVSEAVLLNAALTTWLFNLAIPALVGWIIVLRTDLISALRKPVLHDSQYGS